MGVLYWHVSRGALQGPGEKRTRKRSKDKGTVVYIRLTGAGKKAEVERLSDTVEML